jgi:hypothetical protein
MRVALIAPLFGSVSRPRKGRIWVRRNIGTPLYPEGAAAKQSELRKRVSIWEVACLVANHSHRHPLAEAIDGHFGRA